MSAEITKADWQRVLQVMKFYHRQEGYVDYVKDKLSFFDSDPCLNGVHACHVTRGEVEGYIAEYE